MNIFILDIDTKPAAQYHNDRHVVKMILESAQMLSTAHRVLDGNETTVISKGRRVRRWILPDGRQDTLYSATHMNHPCNIWVRESHKNYIWLYMLFFDLLNEYYHRFAKKHKCEELLEHLCNIPDNIPHVNKTPFALAMPEVHKIIANDGNIVDKYDAVASYRDYYIHTKQKTKSGLNMAKWTKRGPPHWWVES